MIVGRGREGRQRGKGRGGSEGGVGKGENGGERWVGLKKKKSWVIDLFRRVGDGRGWRVSKMIV